MAKINIITLGCSKNLVDSEKISGRLEANGWHVVFDSNSTEVKVVVINTCGFIGDAKQESINTILQFAHAKSLGLIEKLYVIGCLSERYREELKAEIPEVDEFYGARTIYDVVEELCGETANTNSNSRVLSTPSHYAYLKISEGCDRSCGFCAIPLIRGKHTSVPMEELIEEAKQLAKGGVKELIVIAQDTTYYGLDLYGERRLPELLRSLCSLEGIEWIRLHYAYPAQFPDELIEVMAEEEKICKYLDIPFQHISDNQLKAMKRGNDSQGTYKLIARLRERIPDIVLRTTLLTGYPGETEEDFAQLREFVERVGFDRLGVFPYSEEEGTYSAGKLLDEVPKETKRKRADIIMEIQKNISLFKNETLIGKEMDVIIDTIIGESMICRSKGDSPEVDQEVSVPIAKGSSEGDIMRVLITGATEYDLKGIQV